LAIPNLVFQEYQPLMLGLSNQFLKRPIVCEEGHFLLPEGSGLGIEMDEDALSQYVVYP
jgi:galactonate dehydratase